VSLRVGGAAMADEALVAIVRGAVAAVPGARLDTPGRVSRVLPGRRNPVEWELADQTVAFDVDLACAYGQVLPEVAAAVRAHVAAAVTQMTGLTVRAVDVTVTGLDRPGEAER
jgi:uncharacterized alkaline shock family protein YloU